MLLPSVGKNLLPHVMTIRINNRHREDPQTYIAKHVHNKQLFLCPDEVVCNSDTAPS
jgi:hypothetical protein